MATVKENESRCTTCNKVTGTFICRGCGKDFCLKHTNEHRQELNKQMEEDIISLHDQLRQQIQQATNNSDQHPYLKQIDQWERTSIEKIHQTANDYRKQLSSLIDKHTTKLNETLGNLTQKLKVARDNDYFFETDLKQWLEKLQRLKKEIDTPQSIHIQFENDTNSLVQKIVINQTENEFDEIFEQSVGNIQITDNGKVIIHKNMNHHAHVLGRGDYCAGENSFRFRIENLSRYKWAFFGVISKNLATQIVRNQFVTANYGFGGENQVWRNGNSAESVNGYASDFQVNDIIVLMVNCDQRKISIHNERTKTTYTLGVDVTECPFPWKLCVGLYYSQGESIRILS